MGRVEISEAAQAAGFAATVREAAPEAPWFVFLHGLGASRQDWAEAFAVPELAGFTLLAVDLPGFGESPRTEPFTFAGVADRIAQLLEPFAERTILVGHSLGGRIGMMIAERAPLLALVVVDSWLLEQDDELIQTDDIDPWFDRFLAECDRNAQTDVSVSRYVQSLRRLDRTAFHEAAQELERYGADTVRCYAALSLPRVYVACGDAPEEALRLLGDIGLDLERFPEAGHAVMIDEPIAFYAFLVRWAASVVR